MVSVLLLMREWWLLPGYAQDWIIQALSLGLCLATHGGRLV